jgi:hypothetical protein
MAYLLVCIIYILFLINYTNIMWYLRLAIFTYFFLFGVNSWNGTNKQTSDAEYVINVVNLHHLKLIGGSIQFWKTGT